MNDNGRYPILQNFPIFIFLAVFIMEALSDRALAADAYKEYMTKTGKMIVVSETNTPGESLGTIEVRTKSFEHEFQEVFPDRNPISDVFVADLDGNGFDEIYIVTKSAGSGGYGSFLGFASNKDKSLSMIHFPEPREGDEDFEGYMGHDTFGIENRGLVRTFPVCEPGDTNSNPTSGRRKLVYGLHPGEAMWQLKVEILENLTVFNGETSGSGSLRLPVLQRLIRGAIL